MRKRFLSILFLAILLLLVISPASAQSYNFQVPKLDVDVYWNSDGTVSLDYNFVFSNDPSGHIIDYVDLGLPNDNYSDNNITATVNGYPVNDISSSGFQGEGGSGVAIGLGQNSIQPGTMGTVKVHVENIKDVLYPDSQDGSYASAEFGTTWFSSDYVSGITDLTVTFHLPPGVTPEEPKWHAAPGGFPSQPVAGIDEQGRITYTWQNPNANSFTQYKFGASFPMDLVPSNTIVKENPFAGLVEFISAAFVPILCIGGFIAIVASGLISGNRRKRQYLPPKISIEGHGIKRGLTAVEAAILLEEPLDKIFTMILFSVIKKNAAEVITSDPLEIKSIEPLPENLQAYETDFLSAFKEDAVNRRKALRDLIIALVRNVTEKMKGFSRQETMAYYRDITKRAWEQVEAAATPEVKSQKYEEVMEWTMLDKDYDGRTKEVFRNTPVFIPTWWGHYDPSFGKISSKPGGMPASVGGGSSVPGADFAASMAAGMQNFSGKVVGSINDFTSSITSITNPPPKTSTSSSKGGYKGGGGFSCACACACAGCACACAGGGR